MFTKVRLKNFRTFDDIEFDLSAKSGTPKNLAIIYGENGVGKSNLVSAFVLLRELLETMNVRDAYEELLSQKSIFNDEEMEKIMRQQIVAGLRDMQSIINDCKMVGCDKPIEAEYEFNIGGNVGAYYVQLGKSEILHERLEYILNRRKGIYFNCSKESLSINHAIVKDGDFLADIKATAKRFWGKHSILAIILHELYDKSETFGSDNISGNFGDVLGEFCMLSCSIGLGAKRWDKLYAPFSILKKTAQGKISRDKEHQIDLAEQIFTQFFTAINSDIRRVTYEKVNNDQYINYKLVIEKMIAGTYRNIDFSRESAGNHQLLRVLCYLLTACVGGVVVLDEADSGIHDLLFKKLLQEIYGHINGQIIITTHNTMLMESDFARDSTYILYEIEAGHKVIRCVTDYEKRTYLANNIRNKYLNKEYGGLPEIREIDFDSLIAKFSSEFEQDQS
jgi:hypothetical protein